MMATQSQIDRSTLLRAANLFMVPDCWTAVMAKRGQGDGPPITRYFRYAAIEQALAFAANQSHTSQAVFINLNPISDDFQPLGQDSAYRFHTVADVSRRRWILVDFDRASGQTLVSATETEKVACLNTALIELLFVTRYGESWAKSDRYDNPVTKEFRKLLGLLDLHQPRCGFYWLRHTFRTIADGAKDQPAANLVMGHSDGSMSEDYVEEIEDARLVGVVDHARHWLFPPEIEEKAPARKNRKTSFADAPPLRVVG